MFGQDLAKVLTSAHSRLNSVNPATASQAASLQRPMTEATWQYTDGGPG
jgi:hypothetical protein